MKHYLYVFDVTYFYKDRQLNTLSTFETKCYVRATNDRQAYRMAHKYCIDQCTLDNPYQSVKSIRLKFITILIEE